MKKIVSGIMALTMVGFSNLAMAWGMFSFSAIGGAVTISDGTFQYVDTAINFATDCARAGIPALTIPSGVANLIAYKDGYADGSVRGKDGAELKFEDIGKHSKDFYIYIDHLKDISTERGRRLHDPHMGGLGIK